MNDIDLVTRIDNLERQLRRFRLLSAALLSAGAVTLVAACSSLQAAPANDGIIRARGIVITDAKGVERIHIGSPVPSPPGEPGQRIAEATGMIIHDENGRERFGIGHRTDDWTVIGFDAAPGNGTGKNRERLHLGVDAEGRGFVRFLDRSSALAGRLHLTRQDRMAMELWNAQPNRTFKRGALDVEGWRALPDHAPPPMSR